MVALLEEMKDLRGIASFEGCKTEVRYSTCIRQGSVEAPILWEKLAKYVLRKVEEQKKRRGWSVWFGGEHDRKLRLSGLM